MMILRTVDVYCKFFSWENIIIWNDLASVNKALLWLSLGHPPPSSVDLSGDKNMGAWGWFSVLLKKIENQSLDFKKASQNVFLVDI